MYFGFTIGNQISTGSHIKFVQHAFGKYECGKKSTFNLQSPMLWRESQDYAEDCYFCCCKTTDYYSKSKMDLIYPNVQSETHAVYHEPDVAPPPSKVVDQLTWN